MHRTRFPLRLVLGVDRVIGNAMQAWLSCSTAYLLVLLVAGHRPRHAELGGDDVALPVVVLMPAHDEEAGVADAVAALGRQDYPRECLEIIVIADNCSDATAERARAAGATVWERDAGEHPGKGQALHWALDRLWSERSGTAVVAIVDADCEASVNLVSAMARAVGRGANAVQVDYRVSNASATPFASLRDAGFRLKHVIRARGRQRLGLSCSLFGTGMGFSSSLLREIPWPGSVTEDTEFFIHLIEAGFEVTYVEDASVTSPMPETPAASEQQQLRWETGNAQLARRRLVQLTGRGIVRRDAQSLGAAAELAVPSQTLLALGTGMLAARALMTGRRPALATSLLTMAGQVVYVFGGLAAVGGTTMSLRVAAYMPRFLVSRGRILIRVLLGKGARAWVRTAR